MDDFKVITNPAQIARQLAEWLDEPAEKEREDLFDIDDYDSYIDKKLLGY